MVALALLGVAVKVVLPVHKVAAPVTPKALGRVAAELTATGVAPETARVLPKVTASAGEACGEVGGKQKE